MSVDNLPIYPSVSSLDDDTIKTIEESCRQKNHLSADESLLDRIKEDTDILKKNGVNIKDIYSNHRNMYLLFHKSNNYDSQRQFNEEDMNIINKFTGDIPKFGQHWCCQSKQVNEIDINGQHLRVLCFRWGGAEECSIEKHFDKKYHGYKRGDRDWFITNLDNNKSIWIPDLLPAQASMFGFFQSPTSYYRLDPKKYLIVMGINGPIYNKMLDSEKNQT